MSSFENKKVAVLGLARAGIPAAKFLAERGAQVTGYDGKNLEELSDEAKALQQSGVTLVTGEHGYAGLDENELIVLSPGLKIHHSPLKEVLENCEAKGIEVIGELELAYRFCPAPVIAVTGTKGKSTTTKLIAEMLQACGIDAVRAGNTGIPLIAELSNLSPQSWAVVEVSSFQLERAPTFRPRVAVLLNLLEDHQDYHPTLEQYWETKMKLFANQGAGDSAIFVADDERALQYAYESEKVAMIKVSHGGGNPVGVLAGALGVQLQSEFLPLLPVSEIPLSGKHNVSNVAAAVGVILAIMGGEALRDNKEKLASAIRDFQSLPHRLEIVARKHGITWVNDSQATIPDAAIAAMNAFEQPIALIAGGRAKLEESAYEKLGEAIAARAELLLTIGEASEIMARVAERAGMSKAKIVRANNLTNAVKTAKMLLPSGGSVILSPACASFDQFTSFEARGQAFRDAVSEL